MPGTGGMALSVSSRHRNSGGLPTGSPDSFPEAIIASESVSGKPGHASAMTTTH